MDTDKFTMRDAVRFLRHTQDSVLAVTHSSMEVLSIDLLRVALAFTEPATIAQVYASLDVDCDIGSFASIVEDLVSRGLIEPTRPPAESLFTMLSARVDRGALRRSLSDGALVVIPDAFPEDAAERVWSDLHAAHWATHEGDGYRYGAGDLLASRSRDLCRIYDMWQASKTDMALLSGEDCSGESVATASWYRIGDYASPHTDAMTGTKAVAFNWYLGKGWRWEWGGELYWCPTGQRALPMFNTVVLFRISPNSAHSVCPVSHAARSRRMAVNGFWTRATGDAMAAVPQTVARAVTTQVYGHDRPIVVL